MIDKKETRICSHCQSVNVYAKGLCKNCYSRNKRNGHSGYVKDKDSARIKSLIGKTVGGFYVTDTVPTKSSFKIHLKCNSCEKEIETSLMSLMQGLSCSCRKYPLEYADHARSERNKNIYILLSQGKTLQEAGDAFGVSRERARQIATSVIAAAAMASEQQQATEDIIASKRIVSELLTTD